MRRIVCLLLIVLICFSCNNIIKTDNQNNSLYDEITKRDLSYEKLRKEKSDEFESIRESNESKSEELERYKKWNQEIMDSMQ